MTKNNYIDGNTYTVVCDHGEELTTHEGVYVGENEYGQHVFEVVCDGYIERRTDELEGLA